MIEPPSAANPFPRSDRPPQPGRRRILAAASSCWALGTLGALGVLGPVGAVRAASPEPPLPGGPAAPVGVDLEWRDERRQRDVPVRLYWPVVAGSEDRVPLVVFSHGIGGSRQGYRYLGQHLAANGWASLHVQHVGSDRHVWTGGSPFAVLDRLLLAAREAEAIARTEDARFALDEVFAGPWGGRLDPHRIVVAGHSYGANTALLMAGAQVERQGRPVVLRDPRLAAAIVLSAPPFHGEPDSARILSGVTLPTLHITATEDVIRIPGFGSGLTDRVSIFEQVAGQPKALAVFEGGSHSVFTDRSRTGGVGVNRRIKQATQDLVTSFLSSLPGRQVGRRTGAPMEAPSDLSSLQTWSERHSEILSRFVLKT